MMLWRDSRGWTDGKPTIYRSDSERSEGKRSVDLVNSGRLGQSFFSGRRGTLEIGAQWFKPSCSVP
jgi:hypothetical protein